MKGKFTYEEYDSTHDLYKMESMDYKVVYSFVDRQIVDEAMYDCGIIFKYWFKNSAQLILNTWDIDCEYDYIHLKCSIHHKNLGEEHYVSQNGRSYFSAVNAFSVVSIEPELFLTNGLSKYNMGISVKEYYKEKIKKLDDGTYPVNG